MVLRNNWLRKPVPAADSQNGASVPVTGLRLTVVQTGYGGFSSPCGERVKISTPLSVTPTLCSNCADSDRSRVTAVQPSDSTFTCGRPRLIIGSQGKKMTGFGAVAVP